MINTINSSIKYVLIVGHTLILIEMNNDVFLNILGGF